MPNELKPCPFCGSTPYVIYNKYRHNENSYSVKCSNYDCPIIPTTYEYLAEIDAIEAWNRRVDNEI